MGKIVINLFFIVLPFLGFSQIQDGTKILTNSAGPEHLLNDLQKRIKFQDLRKISVSNCYQMNRFRKNDKSQLYILTEAVDKGYFIKGSGVIGKNTKLKQCPFWREQLSVQILEKDNWFKWRQFYSLEGSGFPDLSEKIKKFPKATGFDFEIKLHSSNYGNIKKQARVCFEYKTGKYAYSQPFDVSISEEQWSWIVEQNNKF